MHLRTRLTVGVAATAAAVGALLIPATDAFAAPALTVTPATSLFETAVTSVSGSGFAANQQIALAECNYQTAQTIGLSDPTVVTAACDTKSTDIVFAQADASGNLAATSFTIHTGQMGTDATSVCDFSTNGQCVIAAGDPNTFQLLAASPIAFSNVVVTPSANLTNGQTVQVSGQGLPASTSVAIVECNASVQDSSYCNLGGARLDAMTDAQGNLAPTDIVVKTGQIGSNANSICTASTNGQCVFAVADLQTQQPLGAAPFTVKAPPHVTTDLSISANKGKVDKGEKFSIKGRDTNNGEGVNGVSVKLQSRTNTNAKWSNVSGETTTTKTINGKTGSYKFGGLTEGKTKYYRVKSSSKTTADVIYDAATSGPVKVKFAG